MTVELLLHMHNSVFLKLVSVGHEAVLLPQQKNGHTRDIDASPIVQALAREESQPFLCSRRSRSV